MSHVGSSRVYSNAGEKQQFATSAVAFPGPQSALPANNLKQLSEAEEILSPWETIEESQLLSQPINTFRTMHIGRGQSREVKAG
jgi:hypothetical protein